MDRPRHAIEELPAWAAWFVATYPDPEQRAAVVQEYLQMRQLSRALMDIALRGYVFRPFDPSIDPAVAEGRRQLALEIMRLTEMDPAQLMRTAFKPMTKG